MKNTRYHMLAALCMTVLLLCDCQHDGDAAGAVGSQYWSVWPTVKTGSLEYEKLAVQPWNSGRCEATSNNSMAETENGYYLVFEQYLYYADKSDLSRWVLVCSKPDCEHYFPDRCEAYYLSGEMIIKDNRIYFDAQNGPYPELHLISNASGSGLYSRAMNGSDMQVEYINEDLFPGEGGVSRQFLTAQYWINNVGKLNADGSYTLQCYRVTTEGPELLANKTIYDMDFSPMDTADRLVSIIAGEPSFNHIALGNTPYAECRYMDGELYFTDLTGYYDVGRYLAGSTLRTFCRNDGYYDVDLETREEVRVADACLKNSDTRVLLPNCIVESTLFKLAHSQLSNGTQHAMTVFDGKNWREVKLPKELLEARMGKYIAMRGLTSDSIFFSYKELNAVHLYRIPIQDGELIMEYCGRIK